MVLLILYVGLLWGSIYNGIDQKLFGFPFFHWYQLAWMPVSALLTWIFIEGSTMPADVDYVPFAVWGNRAGRVSASDVAATKKKF